MENEKQEIQYPTYEQLREYYDTTFGLWCIDQNPNDVDIKWIRENAFQPTLTDIDSLCKNCKTNN